MIARFAILLLLGVTACAPNDEDEPCGKPSNAWVKIDDFGYLHVLDFEKLEISHLNQILLNGSSRDDKELKTYFSSRNPALHHFLIFDFDAHSDCKVVRRVRKVIEDTGYCSKKNCLIGNPLMEPPALEPLKTEPS
jgi:hypothetical protein